MKAWSCEHCSAEVREEKEPEFCPICKKRGKWDAYDLSYPTEEDKKITRKYEEVVETIEKYEEGTPPRQLVDAVGCCGGGCCDEEGKKKRS